MTQIAYIIMQNRTWSQACEVRFLILSAPDAQDHETEVQREQLKEMLRTQARIKLRTIKEFVSLREPGGRTGSHKTNKNDDEEVWVKGALYRSMATTVSLPMLRTLRPTIGD